MSIPEKTCPDRTCQHLVRFGPDYVAEWYCIRDMHVVERIVPWETCSNFLPSAPDTGPDLCYGNP